MLATSSLHDQVVGACWETLGVTCGQRTLPTWRRIDGRGQDWWSTVPQLDDDDDVVEVDRAEFQKDQMEVNDGKEMPERKYEGMDRDDPKCHEPPPRHLDSGDKEKEEVDGSNEESDREYEDVDPAGENIFASGPDQGLRRPAPKELPVRRPENKQKESSTYHTPDQPWPEGTNGGEERETPPGFCHKVRDRAIGLWRKCKSSSLFWFVIGALVTVLGTITAILVLNGKNQDSVIGTYPTKPGFPWTSVPDKESSPASYSTSPVSSSKDIPTTTMALSSTTDINECTDKPCQHGTCANQVGGYKCTCSDGWTGQNCQQDINECADKPCQHGRCVNTDGGYKCTCSPGWTGQNCEQDINECIRMPCQHGRCVNQDGGYKCNCLPGWTGRNCQMRSGQDWRQDVTAGQCPGGGREYNNHCYLLVTEKVNWITANSRCRQLGANLSSIRDSEENDFFADFIENVKGMLRYQVWCGLKRGVDGQFRWTDGSPLSYTNWAPGEPDNNGDAPFGKEQPCVTVVSKAGRPFFWEKPLAREEMEANGAKEMSETKYEDMDQDGESIFVLGSGLQRPVSEEPPPLPPRNYEDVTLQGDGGVVLSSGLQRATPNVPPPRHLDMGDKEKEQMDGGYEESKRKYEDPDNESIFVSRSELQRSALNEPKSNHCTKKQVHDFRLSAKKQSKKDADDRNVKPPLPRSKLQPTAPNSTPLVPCRVDMGDLVKKTQKSVLYQGVDDEPCIADVKLGSGLKRTVLKEPPPLPARKYEDTDPHGDFVLWSESQRAKCHEPPPYHLDTGDKESEEVDGMKEESDRKYEDVDSDGGSIFGLSQGLRRPVPIMNSRLGVQRTSKSQAPMKTETHLAFVTKLENQEGVIGAYPTKPGFPRTPIPDKKSSFPVSYSTSPVSSSKDIPTTTMALSSTTDINECADKPCQHGTCVNKDGGYKCICSVGWAGQNCQQAINKCTRKSCQHGFCVNKDGGYKCTCSPGRTGHNCRQDINECIRNPCQHGRCLNKDGGYKCTCSFGWSGQNCQHDIDECNRRPCQHGTCLNKDGGYKCTCLPGWTGQNCQMRSGQDWQQDDTAGHCQRGWAEYNNHCYMVGREPVTWITANSRCGQVGAHVASIQDSEENDFIADIIQNAKGLLRYHVWSGLRRGEDGQFQWTDGSPLSYTNWAECEPDNNGLLTFGKGEKCVSVISKSLV
ncbi:hypothetical protein Bbelb_221080 [Branchiostoma belcheri]|nr:hypothetical protein Bbelb_221080 [Branchiostoma belcheri]